MLTQPRQHLITGDTDPFLPHLIAAINEASHIDITVGFIRVTGLRLLEPSLLDALDRDISIRIVTGDYLNITDVHALRQLMLLKDKGADVRIFESKGKSFHMKAYIFTQNIKNNSGCAFVGSSNISQAALQHGHEWNLRVESIENPERFSEIKHKFNEIFGHGQTRELNHQWIDAYNIRIKNSPVPIMVESGADEAIESPTPNVYQQEALDALTQARDTGYKRGLVVMATGLGKTWLAAFDVLQLCAAKVLFVAHREEILNQAESTFVHISAEYKTGRYTGTKINYSKNTDILFASIQTLGRAVHLNTFPADYFDYIVVDEFHHASARTYRQLLNHFNPGFLLGLTATPERTDQADILSLCDNNLVYERDLFDSINEGLLVPFHYIGIADENVDYQEIAWRNGRFDPTQLINKLATYARAHHALKKWEEHRQQRTLAFCISKKHAEFMAEYFNKKGYRAIAVHSDSEVRRNVALEQLKSGRIDIIFSVDLFNEGVDLPAIDMVLMLRPTDSKIVFLQQLGRGLRTHENKEKLIVVDFIGNHLSFFRKPEALFHIGSSKKERQSFLQQVQNNQLTLPAGCFVNYDLSSIDIMTKLLKQKLNSQEELYRLIKDSKGRRPTLAEFYQAGGEVQTLRKKHGQWLKYVGAEKDLSSIEQQCLVSHNDFFKEIEVTALFKSFKIILLEALIEKDGFLTPLTTDKLSQQSYEVLQRHQPLLNDVPPEYKASDSGRSTQWHTYWKRNPINAWIGGNTNQRPSFFRIENNMFLFEKTIESAHQDVFHLLLQELIDYRLLQYEDRLKARQSQASSTAKIHRAASELIPFQSKECPPIPYFPDLKIACGYFKSSYPDEENTMFRSLPAEYGKLDPNRHFVARAIGNSMEGGRTSIEDGAYLLLEIISPDIAGSISNQILAIERLDITGDGQYLLRYVKKIGEERYELIAHNPDYEPILTNEHMRTFARFKSVINSEEFLWQQ